jgi:Iap family predicted aminopeptidase
MPSLRKLWIGGLVAVAVTLPLEAGEAASIPHRFLEELCDRFGPRLTGSAGNAAALEHLAAELRALGYGPERHPFTMPGWERGADTVEIIAPFRRTLRVAALGYVAAHPAFEADVIDIKDGRPADYPAAEVRGKIGILAASTPLQTREILAQALARGLRGVLFIDREGGGQLLARTGSFQGQPAPLPIYSITQEEGRWLQRLLARAVTVRVRMETRSRCLEVQTANLAVRVPGREPGRIIVGAHFDSWDLGQGAMDNGIGTAQLYALAQALRGATPRHTIELVWFNGEEQGLWGSRHEAARLGDTPVVLMINLDMVGVPIGVNALGDASLVPALSRWHEARATKLPKGVENLNWLASDHTPYQFAGVRAVTFNGPIPRESVRHYHDMADSIDKVPAALLDDSTRVILEVVRALADDATLAPLRRGREETRALFTTPGLDRRLRAMDYWPFD